MVTLSGVMGSPSDLLALLQSANSSPAGVNGSLSSTPGDQTNGFLGQLAGNQAPMPASPTASGAPAFSPNVLAFLIFNQGQPSASPQANDTSPMSPWQSRLFAKLDTNGDGTISKSEFEATFAAKGNTAAAASAFDKLDANGDGSIDPNEMAAARPHRHHHHHMSISDAAASDSGANGATGSDNAGSGLAGLLEASGTSSTAINPDGSTTTRVTYSDGSTITMTQPTQAASGTSAAGASQPATGANTLEALIRLQAQLLASPTLSASSVTPPTV